MTWAFKNLLKARNTYSWKILRNTDALVLGLYRFTEVWVSSPPSSCLSHLNYQNSPHLEWACREVCQGEKEGIRERSKESWRAAKEETERELMRGRDELGRHGRVCSWQRKSRESLDFIFYNEELFDDYLFSCARLVQMLNSQPQR